MLIVSLTLEAGTKGFAKSPEVSVSFFLATLPLYAVVMFGCHSLLSIGYHMIVLGKCSSRARCETNDAESLWSQLLLIAYFAVC